MAFERHGYTFDGAYTSPASLQPQGGVYVVWCVSGDRWTCLDVGEAGNVPDRLMNHERAPEWERHCQATIYYAATYTPGLSREQRMEIERRLRALEQPLCGER